jgi:ClpP class serine protease
MTRRSLPHIHSRLAQPLAILPAKLEEIDAVLASPVQMQGTPPQRQRSYYIAGNVAVVPIGGTLVKSSGGIMAASGLTSYATIAEGLRGALADAGASQILLHIDSPGGEVDGLLAIADQIFEARSQKPITALVDGLAASAAYAHSEFSRFHLVHSILKL